MTCMMINSTCPVSLQLLPLRPALILPAQPPIRHNNTMGAGSWLGRRGWGGGDGKRTGAQPSKGVVENAL